VGGLGSIRGSFLGALLITLLPAFIANLGRSVQEMAPGVAAVLPYAQQVLFGAVIILFLIFEPRGLSKIWDNVKDYFRVWPFAYHRGLPG